MLQAQVSGPQGRKPALLRLGAARPKPRANPSQKHLDELSQIWRAGLREGP